MIKEFKLPDIGEGIHEGEVVRWLVAEGDQVAEDQPIAEVMTDKATVEITTPYAGTVSKLGAGEGDTILVGATLVSIDEGGAGGSNGSSAAAAPAAPAPAAAAPTPPASPAPAAPVAATPQAAPRAATPQAAPRAATPLAPAPVAPAAAATAVLAPPAAATSGPILATPATRRLAREKGIDLRTVAGSGPRGRITREDVENLAAGGAPLAAPAPSVAAPAPAAVATPPAAPIPVRQSGSEQRIPLRGLRRKIAEHMALSKRTAAHFTYVEEADISELVQLRSRSKPLAAEQGVKLTYLPYIMKAVVAGLQRYPMLNSVLDEERGEIVVKHDYNLGVAVDTPNGLVVPVIKGVDQRSILDLAREIDRVATAARTGKSSLDDLRGGTISITNAGNIGGILATPIINYPEVAIIGVHKIARRPVVRGEQIEIGDVIHLSISIDHRVVDGADGARFMNEVVRRLEDPGLLLLESP